MRLHRQRAAWKQSDIAHGSLSILYQFIHQRHTPKDMKIVQNIVKYATKYIQYIRIHSITCKIQHCLTKDQVKIIQN